MAATSALTVSSPSVGGQSITTFGYSARIGSRRSFSRKCASSSPDQLRLELGQGDSRWRDEQVRLRRRQDDVREPAGRFDDRVVDAARDRRDVQIGHRAVGLGVEIDEQRRLAAQRERGGQIDSGRGLPHATLLVRDGNNHRGAVTGRRTGTILVRKRPECQNCQKCPGIGVAGRPDRYILYFPMSSGSRLSSHFCSRSASPLSGAKSTVLALSMTRSST